MRDGERQQGKEVSSVWAYEEEEEQRDSVCPYSTFQALLWGLGPNREVWIGRQAVRAKGLFSRSCLTYSMSCNTLSVPT